LEYTAVWPGLASSKGWQSTLFSKERMFRSIHELHSKSGMFFEFLKSNPLAKSPHSNITMSGDALMALCKGNMETFFGLAKGGIEPVGILFRCQPDVLPVSPSLPVLWLF